MHFRQGGNAWFCAFVYTKALLASIVLNGINQCECRENYTAPPLGAVRFTNLASINRYENGQVAPTVEPLRKYADYFDVPMAYTFACCDDPRGKG